MSLTLSQKRNTIEEFRQNIAISGLSVQQIAAELETDVATIEAILQLRPKSIEEPWILRNYLVEKIMEEGKALIPFSALLGDHHDYGFLNTRKIDKKSLKSGFTTN